jgi:hypothetical protein
MLVWCEQCGKRYDDARYWTICPHYRLEESPRREDHTMTDECAVKSYHPAVKAVLQFFVYSHLPEHLQGVSKLFCDLAQQIADGPQNAEATVALRKLLEAKDAAVRAVLFKE